MFVFFNVLYFVYRIRKIENLSQCTSLKQLYMGKNKIKKMEGLETLVNLTLLSIPVSSY